MASFARLSFALLSLVPVVTALPSWTTTYQAGVKRANGEEITSSLGLTIGSNEYHVPLGSSYDFCVTSGPFGESLAGYTPVTVLDVSGAATCSAIEALVSEYMLIDDVYDPAFMTGLFLQSASSIETSEFDCVQSKYGTSVILSSGAYLEGLRSTANVATLSGGTVPPGPYMLSVEGGKATLSKVYLVYYDVQQAFTTPAVPDSNSSTFYVASTNVPGFETIAIPVPSRVYTYNMTSAARPLEGLRIAVKDIYDIRGLKTGCGNRAFFGLYPPRAAHAVAVQRLIDQGAIIVGKTKTSQFANGETATCDWVDQHAPFNPRGDGYQDPSSSSSGSGASMGSYPWLDHAIGSDTGGSIRNPAGVQGLYGIRPTLGAINLTGVMPLSHAMDTAGYFARDAKSFQAFGKAWYGDHFKTYSSFPKTILMPSDYWPTNAVAEPVFTAFISKMVTFLGATVSNASVNALWNTTALPIVNDTLSTYMNTTYPTLIGYDQFVNWTLPFYADYKAANPTAGMPFVDPVPLTRWAWAYARGGAAYDEELAKKNFFSNWTVSNLVKPDPETCSEAIMLYPQSSATTTYRNVYRSAPGIPTGFSAGRISNLAGVPEVVYPIGQGAYNSTITLQTEYLPITLSLVASAGCDYMLMDLAVALQDAGILGPVMTGKTSFIVQ